MADMPFPADYVARDTRIRRQTYSIVRKLDGLSQELFATYWRDVHAPLCARLPGLGYYVQHHFSRDRWADLLAAIPAVQKLRLHLPEPYDNAHPAPPSPHVDHQVSDERKDIGVVEIGFASPMAARAFFDSAEYRATDARQREFIRSAGVFPVTGIYTYIRDGAITTAGLRGSRPAQLIEQIGAVNQTRADVTRQFASVQEAQHA